MRWRWDIIGDRLFHTVGELTGDSLSRVPPQSQGVSLTKLFWWVWIIKTAFSWAGGAKNIKENNRQIIERKLLYFEWSPPWHSKTACWQHFCLKLLSRDFCPTNYPNHLFHLAGHCTDLPYRMPDDMPDRMPDRMSEKMSDRMSERMPEDIPEDMPDRMPDRMSEKMSEDMSDRMPEDMPDRMPEDMSEYMPEDMPDRMPDRMPEDLPERYAR